MRCSQEAHLPPEESDGDAFARQGSISRSDSPGYARAGRARALTPRSMGRDPKQNADAVALVRSGLGRAGG